MFAFGISWRHYLRQFEAEKMKIFISQPMRGIPEEAILAKRADAINLLILTYPDAIFLDSWIDECGITAAQCLGRSIYIMGNADLVVFLPGWSDARGCRMEEQIAYAYGIRRMYL